MARKYRHRAVRHRDIDGGRVNIRISDGESASPINNLERSRYLSAARLFLKRGDTDRGQRAIKAAAVGTVDPREHLMIMKRLAEIKLAAGNQEEALNSFSRLANRFAAVHLNREALSLFRRVLAVRPESLECLLGSGNALEALGRYCDALAYFRKAQKVMNEGKIVVGRSDVIRKIDFLTKKIESARRASDGA
jgi:tetratricopeptide (TPR) repeat protein